MIKTLELNNYSTKKKGQMLKLRDFIGLKIVSSVRMWSQQHIWKN